MKTELIKATLTIWQGLCILNNPVGMMNILMLWELLMIERMIL